MKRKKFKYAILLLLLFFTSNGLGFSQKLNILVNGQQALLDSTTNTFYATVQREGQDSVRAQIQVLKDNVAYGDGYWVDGCFYADGSTIKADASIISHVVVPEVNENCTADTCRLVLTYLPLVVIDYAANQKLEKDHDTPANITIYDTQDWTEGNVFTSPIMISLRGATASMMAKKSYSVALIDDKGDENEKKLFNIRKTDKWIMDAAAIDYSRMRNRVAFDVWNDISSLRDEDMKRNGTQGQYCELMINGRYCGLYCFSDKINRSLLGLKKTKADDPQKAIHGLLYKCTGASYNNHLLTKNEPELPMNSEIWGDFEMKYPDNYFCNETWGPLANVIEQTNVLSASEDSVETLMKCFYAENFYEYAVFAMSFMLTDNVMHNTYLSIYDYENDPRIWITPWDLDGSLGRDGAALKLDRVAQAWMVYQNCHPFRYYYDNCVEPFMSNYQETWNRLSIGSLSVAHVSSVIDHYAQLFDKSGAWKRERERWDGMQNVWYEGVPINLAPTAAEEAQYMKSWYKKNFLNIQSTITSSVPTIVDNANNNAKFSVYTLDGRKVNARVIKNLPTGIYLINGQKILILK